MVAAVVWRGRTRGTSTLAGALLGLAALTAGCTSTVAGTGALAGGPSAASSTGPAPAFSPRITLIESRRLAYAVPRPDVAVPSFTKPCLPTLPLKSVDALGGFGGLFVDSSVDVFRQDGFVAGYVQCRSDPASGRGSVAAAIEMRDEASARKAAADLVPTLADRGDTVTPLDGLHQAIAVASIDESTDRHVLQTVIPFGRLVLYQYTDDADQDRLVGTAVKILRSALDRAREYTPTPVDRMDQLRDDPHNLRRLVADPSGDILVSSGGYDLDAYYGLAEDPQAEHQLLTDAGFTGMYSNQGNHESFSVYQVRDAAAATTVLAGFTAIERRLHRDLRTLRVTAAGSPSFCFAFRSDGTPDQRCFFAASRYVYQVDAFGFPDASLADTRIVAGLVHRQRVRAPR